MFWSSNKKVFWKDLWSSGFIDMHNHLLWGLDDGAKTFEETMLLCEMMHDLGITEAITTPHTYPGLWNNNKEKIENSFNNYQSKLNNNFIKSVSSEYFVGDYLIDFLNEKKLIPLKNEYLLIEFSLISPPIQYLYEILFKLKLSGYELILAHPERYLYWKNDLKEFEKLKNFDINFQLNALSLTGYYGREVQKLSEKILQLSMYDFLGTDYHNIHQINFTKKYSINNKKTNILENLISNNEKFKK